METRSEQSYKMEAMGHLLEIMASDEEMRQVAEDLGFDPEKELGHAERERVLLALFDAVNLEKQYHFKE